MTRTPHWKKVQRWKTSGQALILIIITFFGLLLFLGLMIDLGQIFLAKGYLRRAADAASLAAAAQFRENRGIDEMTSAADEVARMNGVTPTSVTVETCDSTGKTDAQLCPQLVTGVMPKKLVRVTVVMDYPLTFLRLLKIDFVTLTETSISEAASMDVVLVIDTSESMSWEGTTSDLRDASKCNVDNTCDPFKYVKGSALQFASNILNPLIPVDEQANRLAIVTFANGWQDPPRGTQLNMTWTSDYTVAAGVINGLQVYDPGISYDEGTDPDPDPLPVSVTRVYNHGDFMGDMCLRTFMPDPLNPIPPGDEGEAFSACATTDTGGGLLLAGNQFAVEKRPEALWVVVLLTDGMANATLPLNEDVGGVGPPGDWVMPPPYHGLHIDGLTLVPNYPTGYCPRGDWTSNDTDHHRDVCKDDLVSSEHLPSSHHYDAEDFARDQARFVACQASGINLPLGCKGIKGQSAVIFTIGLGDQVTVVVDNSNEPNTTSKPTPYPYIKGVPYGAGLLRWIAAIGDDGNPSTDLCAGITDYSQNCGNYFFAEHGAQLEKVFEAIYSRIYTRLTQ